MKWFFCIVICLFSKLLFSQTDSNDTVDVLKIISKSSSTFIYKQPIINPRFRSLILDEIRDFNEMSEKEFNDLIIKDKLRIKSLNFKFNIIDIDLSVWKESEFQNKKFVVSLNEDYNSLYNEEKGEIIDNESKFKINNEDVCYKSLITNRVSRPIFNVDHTLAIIQVESNDICYEGKSEITYLLWKDLNEWKIFTSLGIHINY